MIKKKKKKNDLHLSPIKVIAGKRKRLIIFFWSVNFLAAFGVFFIDGWIYLRRAIPLDVGCHAQQYYGAHDFKKEVCSCFQVVWMACL